MRAMMIAKRMQAKKSQVKADIERCVKLTVEKTASVVGLPRQQMRRNSMSRGDGGSHVGGKVIPPPPRPVCFVR